MRRKSDKHLNYIGEKQGELFPESQLSNVEKRGHLFRQDIAFRKKTSLNLTYENLVLFFIVLIMFLVVFFSLGVEKGKRITLQSTKVGDTGHVYKTAEEKILTEEKKSETISPGTSEGDKFEIVASKEIVKKKPSKASAGPYTIQVIAFKKKKNIEKEMGHLENEGYEAFTIPSKGWMQICVGRYANKEKAKKDLDILKKRYPTCYVRKIE